MLLTLEMTPRTIPLFLLVSLICTCASWADSISPAANHDAKSPEQVSKIKRDCTFTIEDLRILDSALWQLALDKKLSLGSRVPAQFLAPYVNGPLKNNLLLADGPKDRFGNPYGPFVIGKFPAVHPKTVEATKDVLGPTYLAFWTEYAKNE